MKNRYIITLFSLFFLANVFAMDFDSFNKIESAQTNSLSKWTGLAPAKLGELTTFIDKASKVKPLAIGEIKTDGTLCAHCPKHMQLSGDINKVLAEMKKDPKVAAEEEIPININRLNFMFYQVKSLQDDGSVSCSRYMDYTKDLKATRLDGDMELMAENVFKFEGASAIQIMDPKKEEIVYYYRGEGDQKNIIVQAILTKDGGKFRYYYYRPTEFEKNPYGLPSMGGAEAADATVKKFKVEQNMAPKTGDIRKPEDKIEEKNKFSVDIDPTLETKMKIIPKNLYVAKAEMSQNIGGVNGVRVGADSNLSLKGNKAAVHISDEEGYQYVKVDLMTSLKGNTTRTITVPYEVTLGVKEDKDSMKVKGNFVDSSINQIVTLSLTDGVTTHLRTELKRDKLTNINSYAVAKDFSIAKDEMATVAVGSNETKNKYVSFQHRKVIKDNITMVLDVRFNQQSRASVMYQLKARF